MDAGKIGLTNQEIAVIINVFMKFPELEKVVIFGSRALGNYKKTSDLDFCIQGMFDDTSSITRMKIELEETTLPYFFDVIDYKQITNTDLKSHIDQYGIEIFRRRMEG